MVASHDQALICDLLDGDEDGVPSGELWEVKGHRVHRRDMGIEQYLEEISLVAENREARRRAAAR